MNLKQIFKLCILICAVLTIYSCGTKKEDSTQEEQTSSSNNWKEMDDFHMVMAETFHPYKDSADLAPIKSKAKELYAAADKWTSSPLPQKVDNEGMKTKLQTLKSETEVLADVVQTGEDKAVGEQLTKVHDLFHSIQEDWYGGHGHREEHEH
ncbi:hypothetical protein [Chryseosolibacter indicus]|uniref:Lipoprotein n=1 Tax=Chryseosolibacter indicus TaxID=2782351 RepID=A0ABS5VLJ3_9BACT|nr:hypothetical protein [Chryseosolibacter indicus]MBT1701873.1 hypothetical protein [Chryseosolibacter indicus]